MARLGTPASCLAACALLVACGGSKQTGPTAEAPLDAAQAKLFSDGVDLLEKPELLTDVWRQQWIDDTQKLAQEAQLIVRGRVTTVRAAQDPDQRGAVDIVLQIDEVLVGEHAGREIVLRSREGADGYGSVQEHRDHLLRTELVAFVRYGLDGGRVQPHFRLVRPSHPVRTAIDLRLGKDSSHRVKIVTHTQD